MKQLKNMLNESKSLNKIIFILILLISICMGLAFNYNYKIIIVRGNSMHPFLSSGDIVIINKQLTIIEQDDIIVFNNENETSIKRVIACPGDDIVIQDGRIFVNEIEIKPYTCDSTNKIYTLDTEQYFVIGDNYLESYDSRNYGPINSSQIIGKAILDN